MSLTFTIRMDELRLAESIDVVRRIWIRIRIALVLGRYGDSCAMLGKGTTGVEDLEGGM